MQHAAIEKQSPEGVLPGRMPWKRGEVIWALWNLIAGERKPVWVASDIPKAFSRRVTNLMDMGVGVEGAHRAGQRGVDHVYDIHDVIDLVIGSELMTFSWPQSEAAAFVRQNRKEIRLHIEGFRLRGDQDDRLRLWIRTRPYTEKGDASLLYYPPEFTNRRAEEADNLRQIDALQRGRLVLELSETDKALRYFLPLAPVSRRGRAA